MEKDMVRVCYLRCYDAPCENGARQSIRVACIRLSTSSIVSSEVTKGTHEPNLTLWLLLGGMSMLCLGSIHDHPLLFRQILKCVQTSQTAMNAS